MRVRYLSVRNFRGIKTCHWHVVARLTALVGAGDATKTTLLDALGLALSPTYSPQFTDADFYLCDTTEPIAIEVAVSELPDYLVQESQFGKDRSGICANGSLVHDPVDGADECLLLRLTVSAELEPKWEIVRPGEEEGRPISAAQRQRLGLFRVGEHVDLHLRWARTSALTGLTENRSGLSSVILGAQREARRAVFDAAPTHLMDAATIAQGAARKLGSAPFGRLRPGLEPTGASSMHALMLHDEEIPLTGFGLGTRRLTSLSIQDQAVAGGSIVVIDEIEHGLEPHRLAHVLGYLRQRAEAAEVQVILTTHSPIAVETLQASDLSVVHCSAGTTVVKQVSAELDNVQGVLRSAPSALLSRRVMVGEGPTEVGFIRGLLRIWDQARNIAGQAISATLGVAVVNGRGSSQPVQRGLLFRQLGYPTVVLLDNDDRSIDDVVTDAEAKGLNVLRWAAGRALEEEIAQCIDEEGLREFVGLAAELKSEDSVRDSVASRLKVATLSGLDPSSWATATGKPLGQVRDAIGAAAKGKKLIGAGKEESKGWFKREDAGELLAKFVSARWSQLSATDIERVISQLSAFAYADDSVSATEDVTKDV